MAEVQLNQHVHQIARGEAALFEQRGIVLHEHFEPLRPRSEGHMSERAMVGLTGLGWPSLFGVPG